MGTRPVALVSGGAVRVGRAMVLRLADAGFDILLTYLNSEAQAQELLGTLPATGCRAVAVRADLTQPAEAVGAITAAFSKSFDRLALLVNNASIYEPDPAEQDSSLADRTLRHSRRMMAIHYESPLLLCRHFAPGLRQSRGHVVNMVDLLAERPWPEYLCYCASKAALMNLTLALARELAPQVTVNGIAPGVVEWPADYPQPEREKYLRRVPLGRAGTAQEAAELVHFLATRGDYITGQIIGLDGGRSIS